MLRILTLMTSFVCTGVISVAYGAVNKPAKAAYIKPVKILSTAYLSSDSKERNVVASYQLACGETFRGALVREKKAPPQRPGVIEKFSQRGGTASVVLELAVVVDRTEAFCSSLPVTAELSLPVYGNVRVRPLKILESRRVVLGEAIDASATESGIMIGWQSGCRSNVGVILKPLSNDNGPKIELSLAIKPRDDFSRRRGVSCERDVEYLSLSGLRFSARDLLLAERPGHIEDSYLLRLVAPTHVSVSSAGELKVAWNKNCREQPVGVLFTGVEGSDVALLTALMPSVPCYGRKTSEALYGLPKGFSVPAMKSLTPITANALAVLARNAQFDYQVLPANSIESSRRGSGDQMIVVAKELTCSQSIGVLVGGDTYGNTSVGVLAADTKTVCPMRASSSMRRLTVPLVGPQAGPIPKVFSLRVFGSTFN